jgi:serine/threonine-protein kinase RIO1
VRDSERERDRETETERDRARERETERERDKQRERKRERSKHEDEKKKLFALTAVCLISLSTLLNTNEMNETFVSLSSIKKPKVYSVAERQTDKERQRKTENIYIYIYRATHLTHVPNRISPCDCLLI